ncbi:MAG: hypothetical protein JWQ36_3485 [Enterovirga sp.]|jgi:septum formation topological specificity factor MinE|nr:hypothetical protein [Enterovirga sp.]
MRSESTARQDRQDELGDLARQIASQLKNESAGPENVLRPNFHRPQAPRPDQVAAINAIVKASESMTARREQVLIAERRAADAEDKVEALKRHLIETEDRLTAALDQLDRERRHSEELERRSAEMLDRTQAMITDACDRLQASEKRASMAEEYLVTLQTMIRERLDA